jgi:hypothetical protein
MAVYVDRIPEFLRKIKNSVETQKV